MDNREANDLINKMKGADLNGLKDVMDNVVNHINPFMTKMMEETRKTIKPKSKKTVSIGDKSVAVSLIEDGRIVINCATLDEAQLIYDELGKTDGWFTNLTTKIFKK